MEICEYNVLFLTKVTVYQTFFENPRLNALFLLLSDLALRFFFSWLIACGIAYKAASIAELSLERRGNASPSNSLIAAAPVFA